MNDAVVKYEVCVGSKSNVRPVSRARSMQGTSRYKSGWMPAHAAANASSWTKPSGCVRYSST